MPMISLFLVSTERAQRTRELGLRTALGARPAQILSTVIGRGVGPVGIGAIFGFIAG
jgi:ABC-type antimicrobial peptide transport system permease subunit